MRKPYPKIKLTKDEYDAVEAVAKITGCGKSWFSIATNEIYLGTGRFVRREKKEYDRVYDFERGRYLSLQFGLKLLSEAFDDGVCGLNRKELKKIGKRWKKDYVAIWDNLLKRMK